MKCAPLILVALIATPLSARTMPQFTREQIASPHDIAVIPLPTTMSFDPATSVESRGLPIGDFRDGAHVGQPRVRHVTVPTITPVLPKRGTATAAAVIVARGGAFKAPAIVRPGDAPIILSAVRRDSARFGIDPACVGMIDALRPWLATDGWLAPRKP